MTQMLKKKRKRKKEKKKDGYLKYKLASLEWGGRAGAGTGTQSCFLLWSELSCLGFRILFFSGW